MVCNNQVIPLNFTGQLGCYRVSVVEDTCIQPGTEALVRGHINEYPSTKNEVGLGIIEPCDKFVAKDSALMARTLVKASETVPLRFMNVSNVVKIIRAGTIVGNISPIQDVISDDKNITDIHKDQNLRIELQKLLSNCSENLSQEQKRGVENLLNEYKDLFAASDRDLGRTNLVRHTINTGNNAPVKQPPRRTPIHMREEVDRHIDDMLERGVIEPADEMVNTNVTVRNRQDWRCHFCNTDCKTEGAWDVHTLKCAKEKREREKFRCTESGCNYASSRKQDLNRHRKRVHGLEKSLEESDWETQNPVDLEKPTKPNPVAAPKRKQELNDMLQKISPMKIPRVSCTVSTAPASVVSDSSSSESDNSTTFSTVWTATPVVLESSGIVQSSISPNIVVSTPMASAPMPLLPLSVDTCTQTERLSSHRRP
ncbi:Hypothetical predicted protein [Mytilus galloprovincialis]|uniref:C2H2-type domain-containing protein n=1 Tax=Mytilus galloprovincialis TaxID=29158 RepID=A0A8B6BPS7_MYTGA|nr:Hypothetical predicted protein [Mytilus galloprovincialis]